MIRLGTALKSKEPPFHRCIVLSSPEENGGWVVLARITTDDGTWPDRDCILTPADWSELDHNSTVAYSTCKFGRVGGALEAAIKKGQFEVIEPPPIAVVRRIIVAALSSKGMPPGAKKHLAEV